MKQGHVASPQWRHQGCEQAIGSKKRAFGWEQVYWTLPDVIGGKTQNYVVIQQFYFWVHTPKNWTGFHIHSSVFTIAKKKKKK